MAMRRDGSDSRQLVGRSFGAELYMGLGKPGSLDVLLGEAAHASRLMAQAAPR